MNKAKCPWYPMDCFLTPCRQYLARIGALFGTRDISMPFGGSWRRGCTQGGSGGRIFSGKRRARWAEKSHCKYLWDRRWARGKSCTSPHTHSVESIQPPAAKWIDKRCSQHRWCRLGQVLVATAWCLELGSKGCQLQDHDVVHQTTVWPCPE